MSLIYWLIIAAVWIIGIPVAYHTVVKKWDNPKAEKYYFSAVWPLLLPLYLVHYFHNKK
jgi:hypothetical protein